MRLGGLDILVNNAGVGAVAGVLGTPLDTYDAIMGVNVRGAFVAAQACFPHLEATGGCMLHVASDAGVAGEEDIAIYSVSKAALIMLSNMLAVEGGRRGVRSNAICPGDTEPGMRHMAVPGEDERPDDVSTWPVPPIGRARGGAMSRRRRSGWRATAPRSSTASRCSSTGGCAPGCPHRHLPRRQPAVSAPARRTLALVDGEHHPSVTRDAIGHARSLGYDVVAAVLVGGTKKLTGETPPNFRRRAPDPGRQPPGRARRGDRGGGAGGRARPVG